MPIWGTYREVDAMSMVISAASVLSRAYTGNTNFKNKSFRENSTNHDVVSADRKAMARALERLEDLDFDSKDDDDGKSIYNTVTSFLDIYNNAVSSTADSGSTDITRTSKEMKKLMKEYSDELEAIGISVKSDGTVKIDKSELKKATTTQVSKVFGNSDYIDDMKKLMKKLRNQVSREVPRQEDVKNDSLMTETVGRNLNLYG